MAKKIITIIAVVLLCVFLMCFVQLLLEKSWFETLTLSDQLIPLDLFGLIVTSIITIWVAVYLGKKLTEQRYEKEYLIADLKEIETQICTIERSVMEGSIMELQSLLGLLNKLRTGVDRFTQTVDVFNISINVHLLDKHYCYLYNKTTDVEGDHFEWTDTNKNEINQICSNFIVDLRKIICTVNKQ